MKKLIAIVTLSALATAISFGQAGRSYSWLAGTGSSGQESTLEVNFQTIIRANINSYIYVAGSNLNPTVYISGFNGGSVDTGMSIGDITVSANDTFAVDINLPSSLTYNYSSEIPDLAALQAKYGGSASGSLAATFTYTDPSGTSAVSGGVAKHYKPIELSNGTTTIGLRAAVHPSTTNPIGQYKANINILFSKY